MASGVQISLPFDRAAAGTRPGKARGRRRPVVALVASGLDVSAGTKRGRNAHAGLRIHEPNRQVELVFPSESPQLFVHEGARQALERRLQALLNEYVRLSITDNVRTMVSSQLVGHERRVRLHHMFLDADAFTLRALAAYLKRSDRAASTLLGGFIEANRTRIRRPRGRRIHVRTAGEVHHLHDLYDRLNAQYFADEVDAAITWGRRGSGRRRRRNSIKLGSYCAEEQLIRIHPALDQVWVPRYFVEYIVYHEMLHHVIPMPERNGRRQLHTPEFRAREREFLHYERAIAWERQHVHRLLRN
jgi:predicted metal-dependent hydrolase